MAIYRINSKFNGIEVHFDAKPEEAIRSALKNSGFRWHKTKHIWYAKHTPERLEAVKKFAEEGIFPEAAEAEIKNVEPFTPERLEAIRSLYTFKKTEEGTIYEGWKGCNENYYRSDQELKSAILAEFKKHGIRATARTGRGGWTTSFTFTVYVPKECQVSKAEFIKSELAGPLRHYWYRDQSGKDIHRDTLWEMSQEERDRIITFSAENAFKHRTDQGREAIPTDDFQKTIKTIVDSFNHDNSDTMTDYFDVGIYDHYVWKAA